MASTVEVLARLRLIKHHKDEWREILKLLSAQKGNVPIITVAATRALVQRVYDKATADGVVLHKPLWDDPLFAKLVLSDAKATLDEVMSEEELAEIRREQGRNRKLRWYIRKRQLSGKTYYPLGEKPKVRAPYRHKCRCGKCTTMVSTRARFAQSHAQRIVGLLIRIEHGNAKREELPRWWLDKLLWRRCPRCLGWAPTTDVMGTAMTGLGYGCKYSMTPRQRVNWARKIEALKATQDGDAVKTDLQTSNNCAIILSEV